MYKHILIAAELVEENRYVEDKAAQMQLMCGAKLSIIHVIEPLPPAYGGVELGTIPDYNDAEKILTERAEKMIKPIAKRLEILSANTIIAHGKVSKEVLSYADNNEVDLIITCSHGRHGLQLILGSTANALLHHANCDVLSVRLKSSS
jgi:universal stress protein A